MRTFAAAAAFALMSARAFAGSNSSLQVTVLDQNNNPIQGAGVAALFFNNGNPDPNVSQFVQNTSSAGVALFDPQNGNALVDGDNYIVVVTTQGYTPNIVGQFNGGAPGVFAQAGATQAVTVTLTATAGLAQINVPVVYATTGTLIFGQIGLQAGGGAVEYALTQVVAGSGNGGTGTLKFHNIAPAQANTYVVSAFDPTQNNFASLQMASALAAGQLLVSGQSLSFFQAPPPVNNLSQTQLTGSGGGLSASGVLIDTNSIPIPYVPINFGGSYLDQFGQMHNDWRGTNTDQNGNFQLYGLVPGTSYYTSVFGACSGIGANAGVCYTGFQDNIGSFTAHDFFYPSSATVVPLTIKLNQAPPSTGKLAVYVQDQFGNPFPQSGIGLWPDFSPWSTAGGSTCGPPVNNPGTQQINQQAATGYALLSGLPSGNYSLSAWTSYGQSDFNQPSCTCGPTGCSGGCYAGTCPGTGGPFFRLTIDTTPANGVTDARIFDVFGNQVGTNVSSITVIVNVSTSNTGVVQGTLTFPSQTDLSNSPIVITLFPQCTPMSCPPGGGFKVLKSATTPASSSYSIAVASGASYFMQIQSNYWGAVFPGGQQPSIDLTVSTFSVVNLRFTPAGRIVGTMRKPDGSAYVTPSGSNSGGNPGVQAEGGQSWGGNQINNDGSFVIGGLQPGKYILDAQNWGTSNFPYTTQQPAPTVTVVANQDAQQDLILANAVTVRPRIQPAGNPTSVLPPMTVISCGPTSQGDCPAEDWVGFALPAGSPLNADNVTQFLAHANTNAAEFDFSPSSGQISGHCNGQFLTQPGFCTKAVPAQPSGTSYDFYLMRKGNFDSHNTAQGARPYFVIEASTKSVVIGPTKVNDGQFDPFAGPSGSTTPVQDIDLTPAASLAGAQQAVLAGAVTVSNLITQQQFQQLAGDFSKFLKYLPVVWVYDSSGTLKAAGMVVPFPPAELPFEGSLQGTVGGSNYAAFKTILGPAPAGWGPVGYEIRGLTAGQAYNLVVTTPNYPPYKTSVTLGVAQSTTSLNINLDSNPGSSLSGLVKSTNAVAIAGAQVTISASGYAAQSLTTDSSGAWSINGLNAGRYQVLAVAAGYAQAAQSVTVAASSAANAGTLTLSLAAGAITGTVYTNNPICPAGTVCAAFGKTVLQGISVVAYDDTVSGLNPGAPLPLYKAVTNSSGVYTISGLLAGDAFTVFVHAPGYFVVSSVTTPSPTATGVDFSLKPKPLSVDVYGSPVGSNYEFQIRNYKQFSSGKAYYGLVGFSTSPCNAGNGCTDVSANFQQKPDAAGNTELVLDLSLSSLSSGSNYQLILVAQPNDPTAPPVVKIVNFGLGIPNNTCQSIDQTLLGDDSANAQGLASNLAPLDANGSGNASGVSMPVGGVIPSVSTAVPTLCMSQTAVTPGAFGVSSIINTTPGTVGASSFASGIYNVTLSSINYNKGIDLALSYNQNGSNLNDLAIYAYNAATNQWDSVPGTQTLDPVRGTISISGLKNLASVLSVGKPGVRAEATGRFTALFNGHQHGVNPLAAGGSDSATFAILKPSLVVGGISSITTVKVFNFPNPFNLDSKNVPLNTAASNPCNVGGPTSVRTNGTVIKAEVPAGISGQAAIRVYTVSGRLVNELDAGVLSGAGQCVYINWDGTNRGGEKVADGLYYGILTVNGNKSGGAHGIFKMAVVK